MHERIRGALLGTMIWDALGRPFEGTPSSDRDRLGRAVGRRVSAPRAWGYSDDAEMMLAVGDSIVARRTVEEAHIIETLNASHDVARGYGKGTRAAFREWRETGSWELASRALWAEGSRGNGAAVRVAPVSILHRESEAPLLRAAARRSALPTHAHEDALAGAEVVALAVWLALRGADPPALLATLRGFTTSAALDERLKRLDVLAASEDAVAVLGNGVLAVESVPLAVWAHCRHTSFEAALIEAVSAGGDTDTIGAMTGAMAGATYGAGAIPQSWIRALEAPGRRRVEKLAGELVGIEQP